jgi:hypothetical protein
MQRSRIKPRKQWNNEGVASTVGTIMALMVFLAFLSMFTNQYIPVWMEENESSHMNIAFGQFCNLKQAIDMQILAGTIKGSCPISIYTPITLGANGIPIFASPTPGYLGAYNSRSYDNLSFSFNAGNVTNEVIQNISQNTGGTILLEVPNRYYVHQNLAYENGAIILNQTDGEYMKSAPQLLVRPSGGGRFDISYTQIELRGDDTRYVGFGTRGVQTVLRAVTSTTFTDMTNSNAKYPYLIINHTTRYENAWYTTLNNTFASNGMKYASNGMTYGDNFAAGEDYWISSTVINLDPMAKTFEVSVWINPSSISYFTHTVAYVDLVTSEVGVAG